jgi:hypothetical protein
MIDDLPFLRKTLLHQIGSLRTPNAWAQKPKALHDEGQHSVAWQQTVMRDVYAETAERDLSLSQRFVSQILSY